jgi:hypothetical protein
MIIGGVIAIGAAMAGLATGASRAADQAERLEKKIKDAAEAAKRFKEAAGDINSSFSGSLDRQSMITARREGEFSARREEERQKQSAIEADLRKISIGPGGEHIDIWERALLASQEASRMVLEDIDKDEVKSRDERASKMKEMFEKQFDIAADQVKREVEMNQRVTKQIYDDKWEAAQEHMKKMDELVLRQKNKEKEREEARQTHMAAMDRLVGMKHLKKQLEQQARDERAQRTLDEADREQLGPEGRRAEDESEDARDRAIRKMINRKMSREDARRSRRGASRQPTEEERRSRRKREFDEAKELDKRRNRVSIEKESIDILAKAIVEETNRLMPK